MNEILNKDTYNYSFFDDPVTETFKEVRLPDSEDEWWYDEKNIYDDENDLPRMLSELIVSKNGGKVLEGKYEKKYIITVMLSQQQLEVKMLVDSGSSRSTISKKFVDDNKLKLTEFVKKKTFRTWKNVIIDIYGNISERTAFSQHVFTQTYNVVDLPDNVEYQGVIGRDIFQTMGIKLLIPQGYTPSGKDEDELKSYTNRSIGEVEKDKLEELKKFLEEDFLRNRLLTTLCNHKDAVVKLPTRDEKKTPVYIKQFTIADANMIVVDNFIEKSLERGIIRTLPVGEHVQYNNPLLVHVHKDIMGNPSSVEPRVVLVPLALNENTVPDRFPLPSMYEILRFLMRFKIFGEIDLRRAFHQFKIRFCDQNKTAFTWRGKRYVYQVLPMGVTSGSSIFQKVMSDIYSDLLEFVGVFVDNVIVGSDTWEEHFIHMKKAINRLTEFSLIINEEKTTLATYKIRSLGFEISYGKKYVSDHKRSEVREWIYPKSNKVLAAMLGFTTFLREHIQNYASIVAPLVDCNVINNVAGKKKQLFSETFTEDCKNAFDKLKIAVENATTLNDTITDIDADLHIITDASDSGIGAVLYQPRRWENTDKPTAHNIIAFFSKRLNSAQKNYHISKKEQLAILTAVRKWHDILFQRHFFVHTDNDSLTWKQVKANRTLNMWGTFLQEYILTYIFTPRVHNTLADFLSQENKLCIATDNDIMDSCQGFTFSVPNKL